MTTLAPHLACVDLAFQGMPRIIAAASALGPDGVTLIDPGPASTLPALRAHLAALGASVADVTALLLTHIHLDHAGAAGTLVHENPRIRVYVHDVGAPHLIDPSKLLASAGRLYGERMHELWGEVRPVDRRAVVPLRGGEEVGAGGRPWRVAYTPGHASHHVSYYSPETGIAFVGDTAGVQVVRGGWVLPPTPPPDIDIPLWRASLDTIAAWHPGSLFLTHFGLVEHTTVHLAELRDHLGFCEEVAKQAIVRSAEPDDQERWFVGQMREAVARRVPAADLAAYEVAGRFDLNWRGLHRFLTRRRAGEAVPTS